MPELNTKCTTTQAELSAILQLAKDVLLAEAGTDEWKIATRKYAVGMNRMFQNAFDLGCAAGTGPKPSVVTVGNTAFKRVPKHKDQKPKVTAVPKSDDAHPSETGEYEIIRNNGSMAGGRFITPNTLNKPDKPAEDIEWIG